MGNNAGVTVYHRSNTINLVKLIITNAIPDSSGGAGDFNLVEIDPFNRLEFDAIKGAIT